MLSDQKLGQVDLPSHASSKQLCQPLRVFIGQKDEQRGFLETFYVVVV